VNVVEKGVRRFDQFQQRHAVLAVPIAVMQKFGNDQAGGKAVQIAYYGLFSLFPLLLLLATLLGYVLHGHPQVQKDILNSALSDFPIIGPSLQGNTHSLQGSAIAVTVGVLGTLYGAQGVGQAALNAMNSIWNVPYKNWPNFFGRRLRGYAWLATLGLSTVASTTIAGFGSAWLHGDLAWVWTQAVAFLLNFGVFYFIFAVLVAGSLGWRDVIVGVVLATVFWQGLQLGGGLYVRHSLTHADEVYGFFAIVIGLLSWLFIAAQLMLLAAEINVVRLYHLWPRSLTQPPLIAADRATFERLAKMEERRPEVVISIGFTPDADFQPLDAGDAPVDGGDAPAATEPDAPQPLGRSG
jgi:YihY family inner membrane protein